MTDIKTVGAHTPGPWVYEYDNDTGPSDDYFVEFYRVSTTGLLDRCIGDIENEADARLVCAAPDLLEALEEIMASYDPYEPICEENAQLARKAIARARGEA